MPHWRGRIGVEDGMRGVNAWIEAANVEVANVETSIPQRKLRQPLADRLMPRRPDDFCAVLPQAAGNTQHEERRRGICLSADSRPLSTTLFCH